MRKNRPEADTWWHALLGEMQVHRRQTGKHTRVIITPAADQHHLQIRAEIWRNEGDAGTFLEYGYTRDYPHFDANYLSLACWHAVIRLWKMHDQDGEREHRDEN